MAAAVPMVPSANGVMSLLENRTSEPLQLKVLMVRASLTGHSTLLLGDNKVSTWATVDLPAGEEWIKAGKIMASMLLSITKWNVKKTKEVRNVFLQEFTIVPGSAAATTAVKAGGKGSSTQQQQEIAVAALTSKSRNWRIKVRVTSKSAIRTWTKEGRSGTLASVDVIDEVGTEMRCMMFGAETKSMYERLEVGASYWIADAVVKEANKKFSKLPHGFELTLIRTTSIVPVSALEGKLLPFQKWAFVPIASLAKTEPGGFVDVLAVITRVGDQTSIFSKKKNEDFARRVVTLADRSRVSIDFTLWGKQAEEAKDWKANEVMAVKSARLDLYQSQRQLSCSFDTICTLQPQHPDAPVLREWYLTTGQSMVMDSLSGTDGSATAGDTPWKTLDAVRLEGLGMQDGVLDVFRCIAMVTKIWHDVERPCWYLACGADSECTVASARKNCSKKAIENSNTESGWDRCPYCKRDFERPTPRYMLNLILSDPSGSLSVTAFNQTAEQILGVKAEVLFELHSKKKTEEYNRVFDAAVLASFQFKLRAKLETNADQNRTKVDVVQLMPINFKQESRRLLETDLKT